MADNNLDDFFAKRDKKKTKGKKFETVDDVAKILETKAKERKKAENYVSPPLEAGEPAAPVNEYRSQADDDEWKELVEEKPDYTGLKIHDMVLEDEEEIGAKDVEGREEQEALAREGPWSKKAQPKKTEAETPDVEIPEVQQEPAPPKTINEIVKTHLVEEVEEVKVVEPVRPPSDDSVPKKYIPPSQRKQMEGAGSENTKMPEPALPPMERSERTPSTPSGGGGATGGAYVPPWKRSGGSSTSSSSVSSRPKKPTVAPNINEENFPTLG